MLVRMIRVSALALVASTLAIAPAHALGGAKLSIADITVLEPSYPDRTGPAVFTLELDKPADDDVTVDFHIGPAYSAVVEEYGSLTIRQGDLSGTLTATVVRYPSNPEDHTFPVTLSNLQGASFAAPVVTAPTTARATGTVVNTDMAGRFGCAAAGLNVSGDVTPVAYGSKFDTVMLDDPFWLVSAGAGKSVAGIGGWCADRTASEGVWSGAVPADGALPAVEVSVTGLESATTAPFTRDTWDNTPRIGDGGTAYARVGHISVGVPGATIEIEGGWASVSGTCAALDTYPDYVNEGGSVGTVRVNGVVLADVPETLQVNGVQIAFNAVRHSTQGVERSAIEIARYERRVTEGELVPPEVFGTHYEVVSRADVEFQVARAATFTTSTTAGYTVPGGSACSTH